MKQKNQKNRLVLIVMVLLLAACGSRPEVPGAPDQTPSAPPDNNKPVPTSRPQTPSAEASRTPETQSSPVEPTLTPRAQVSAEPAVTRLPATPTASPGGSPLPAPQVITFADNQQTVHLAVGQSLLLQLGGTTPWKVTVGDPHILTLVPGTTTAGTQGRYQAQQIGQTTLEARAEPECLKANPPCRAPIVVFTLTVQVVSR